jgi:hypothetical protein
LGLKVSSLRNKIQTNRSGTQDMRGRHETRPRKTLIIVKEDVKNFLSALQSESTHYGRNKKKRYLEPEFGNVSNIHKLYLSIYTELQFDVSYQVFLKIFKECKLSFDKPKQDICEKYDKIKCEIINKKNNKEFDSIPELESQLKIHQKEAKIFYDLKHKLISRIVKRNQLFVMTSKNLQMPITNVSVEYYLRKFYC